MLKRDVIGVGSSCPEVGPSWTLLRGAYIPPCGNGELKVGSTPHKTSRSDSSAVTWERQNSCVQRCSTKNERSLFEVSPGAESVSQSLFHHEGKASSSLEQVLLGRMEIDRKWSLPDTSGGTFGMVDICEYTKSVLSITACNAP